VTAVLPFGPLLAAVRGPDKHRRQNALVLVMQVEQTGIFPAWLGRGGSMLTVRAQLALGFGAVAVATLVTGGVSALALRSTVERKDEVARGYAEDLSAIERLRYRSEQLVATSRGYLLTGDRKYLEHFANARWAFEQTLLSLETDRFDDDQEFLQRIASSGKYYAKLAEAAAKRRGESKDPALVIPYFEDVVGPARELLEGRLDEFLRHERTTFADAFARSRQNAWEAEIIVGATTAIALLLSAWLAVAVLRRLTQQFRREQEAAEAARRAAAGREEVLAVVSHDLQNPLVAILLGSSRVQRQLPREAEALRPRIDAIYRAGRRMQHLIEDLLDAARIDAGKLALERERCEVSSLIAEVGELFEAKAAAAGVRLREQVPVEATIAWLDRERLLQVLSNLVGNALSFTPDGGEVTVCLERDDGALRFSVADTGTGIAPDDLPRLFDRHWQARRSARNGMGLGLYISRSIVEAHGGKITVTSKVGQGSTFMFTIPVGPVPSQAAAPTSAAITPLVH
jgi:signal transduction histidine kinase